MKILDKYVAKSFLTGYVISLLVLVGLCVVVDLLVNVDEFVEYTEYGFVFIAGSILRYYGAQSALYFRDLAGIIIVLAAVFSLGKMTRNNELIAIMASGISLKRVIAPIIVLSVVLTSLVVIDQEIIIPRLVSQLVRGHDYDRVKGESYDFWFLTDSNGHLISATQYVEREETMYKPLMIIRRKVKNEDGSIEMIVIGDVKADKAIYNRKTKKWDLENAIFSRLTTTSDGSQDEVPTFDTDITPADIPIRQQESYTAMLSSKQLLKLADDENKLKLKDQAELHSQKHFRVTDPIINLVMLMVALPVLVCRDPKSMKSAVAVSFTITASCFLAMFACKMVATEAVFGRIIPHFWAWLPVIIFLPIAFIELDSMKT